MIDGTNVRAHQQAAGAKKGHRPDAWNGDIPELLLAVGSFEPGRFVKVARDVLHPCQE